jgi:aspartyl-tRNA(Asn)/glutamyl-tRNA(Gln) amidotransferase subunit C
VAGNLVVRQAHHGLAVALFVERSLVSCAGRRNIARERDREFPQYKPFRGPMAVDAATVKKIGRLARIRVNDDEVEKYQGELNAILGFVAQLDEVDVAGVEPMTSVTPMQLRRRDDKVTDGGYPEKIVANAPLSEDNFFMVPKVVE